MKRLSGILCILLLGVVAMSFSCSNKAKMADGVWLGEGDAFKGKMTVSIVVKDGKIFEANLVKTADSVYALETIDAILAQAVVAGNANKLDAISGATGTSNGTIQAIKAAQASEEAAYAAASKKK